MLQITRHTTAVIGFALLALQPFSLRVTQAAGPPQQTIQNLNKAMGGEANASHRYSLFAKRADADGHPQVAKLFRAISKSESIHKANHEAVIKQLGGKVEAVTLQPVQVGTTEQNLLLPIQGEKKEESEMYPEFIKQARKDRAPAAVETFTFARDAELQHETLFKQALKNLGHNAKTDYFVNSRTGATVQRKPGSRIPASEVSKGEYIKIE